MDANEKTLALFTTRMRQLILQYKEKTKENAELYTMVDEQEKQIKELQQQLADARHDYETLKIARMIDITDADIEGSKKRLASIISNIDKCITLLNEK